MQRAYETDKHDLCPHGAHSPVRETIIQEVIRLSDWEQQETTGQTPAIREGCMVGLVKLPRSSFKEELCAWEHCHQLPAISHRPSALLGMASAAKSTPQGDILSSGRGIPHLRLISERV